MCLIRSFGKQHKLYLWIILVKKFSQHGYTVALKITLFKCVQSLMLVHLLLELIASNSLINFPFFSFQAKL